MIHRGGGINPGQWATEQVVTAVAGQEHRWLGTLLYRGGELAVALKAVHRLATHPAPLAVSPREVLHSIRPAAPGRLVHLTDETGLQGIRQSGQIVGTHGIYAVPAEIAEQSTLIRVIRTGLPPSRTTQLVPIPEETLVYFRRPIPIGPYSAWQRLSGIHYAPPGHLDLATGILIRKPAWWGPGMSTYAMDAGIYAVPATTEAVQYFLDNRTTKK